MDIVSRTLSRGSRVRVAGQLLTGGSTLRLAPVWTDPSEQREAVESMAVDLVGWHGAVPTSGARVAGTWNGTAVDVATVEPVELDFVSLESSSALAAARLAAAGGDPSTGAWLGAEYALTGGSFPIRVRGVGGVVAAATVSGLDSMDDHDLVVRGLRGQLDR